MQKIAVLAARDNFADVLNQVAYGKTRFVLHRRGKELAALVPLADLEIVKEHLRSKRSPRRKEGQGDRPPSSQQ